MRGDAITGRPEPRHRAARSRMLLVGLVVAAAACAAGCTRTDAPAVPVSQIEALAALQQLHGLATLQTPEAMGRICEQARLTGCHGLSGGIRFHPESAPGPGTPVPSVLCSRGVGTSSRMLVVEGTDGYDRRYVSQVVLDRDDDGRVVPRHEAAFWLGISYHGTDVTGPTGLTTAHSPQEGVDLPPRTEEALRRARAACDPA